MVIRVAQFRRLTRSNRIWIAGGLINGVARRANQQLKLFLIPAWLQQHFRGERHSFIEVSRQCAAANHSTKLASGNRNTRSERLNRILQLRRCFVRRSFDQHV